MSDIIIKNPVTIVKEAEASGTVNINSNGTHDVKGYAYANVNVPNTGNAGGGVTISKLTSNMAVVSPPGANRSLYPKSTDSSGIFLKRIDNANVYLYNFNTDTTVTNNSAYIDLYTLSTGVYLVWATSGRFQLGTYAMGSTLSNLSRAIYQNAYYNALLINITNNRDAQTGTATLYMVGTDNGTLTTTGSGEKYIATYKNVNIPAPNLSTLTVDKNGTYNASDYTHNGRTVDGFNRVIVEIAQSGGGGSALKSVGESLTQYMYGLYSLSISAGGSAVKRINVDTGEITDGSIIDFYMQSDGNYFMYCPTGILTFSNNDGLGDFEAGMVYVNTSGNIKYSPVPSSSQNIFPYSYTITGNYLITNFWVDYLRSGELNGIYLYTTDGGTITLWYNDMYYTEAGAISYRDSSGNAYYAEFSPDMYVPDSSIDGNQLYGVIGMEISAIEIVPGETDTTIASTLVEIIENLDKIFSPYQMGEAPPSTAGKIADGSLTTLTAEDLRDVRSIRSYAFAYNDNLVNITIPSSVGSIGSNAFYSTDTTKKKTFRFLSEWPELPPELGSYAINPDTTEKIIMRPGAMHLISSYNISGWTSELMFLIEEEQ